MKRFVFTLERMRSYKEQVLDREKNTLRQLRLERDGIAGHIERLEEECRRVSDRLQTSAQQGISATELTLYHFQRENMRLQLEQLFTEKEEAEKAVEKQLTAVVSLSQEVSGLDKLEERQREVYNQEARKADELFISELITAKLSRNRDEKPQWEGEHPGHGTPPRHRM